MFLFTTLFAQDHFGNHQDRTRVVESTIAHLDGRGHGRRPYKDDFSSLQEAVESSDATAVEKLLNGEPNVFVQTHMRQK